MTLNTMIPPLLVFTLAVLTALVSCQQHGIHQQQQAQYMGQQQQMGVPQGGQQQAYGQQQQFGQQGVPQNQNLLRDKANIQDREHIKEHLQGLVDHPDVSKMTEEELQFHYFKMHDNDDNNKLDGCELIKSLIHWHVEESKHITTQGTAGQPATPQGHQHQGQAPPTPGAGGHGHGHGHDGGLGTTKIFTDGELALMIDPIMDMDDRNKDGFIDYPEFVAAQQSRGF